MKIGFDITTLSMPRTGIGQYQHNLLESLLKIDKENFYNLYAFNLRDNKKYKHINFDIENKNAKINAYKIPQRLITGWWMFLRWPLLENITEKCDLYQISEICQQPTKQKTVAFIHDLTTIFYPKYHLLKNRILYHERFKNIKKYADAILTNSEYTKNDIIKHLGINPDKIFVTYFGTNKRFRPTEDNLKSAEIRNKYSINYPYICYLGTLEPRKNLSNLIKAFHYLKKMKKIPHKLLLIGNEGWFYEPIYKQILDLDLSKDIIKTGFADDEEVPYLLNGADVFVYPSFYEGFGMPTLEAMACGTPVVTSNSSALPEICADAAKYCNPQDPKDIAQKILEFISSEDKRKEYSKKGLKRASEFSWNKCAKKTLSVYEKVVGK